MDADPAGELSVFNLDQAGAELGGSASGEAGSASASSDDERIWGTLTRARQFLDARAQAGVTQVDSQSTSAQSAPLDAQDTGRYDGHDTNGLPFIVSEAPLCPQPGWCRYDPLFLRDPESAQIQFLVCKNIEKPRRQVSNKESEWSFNPQRLDVHDQRRYRQVSGQDYLYFNTVGFKKKAQNTGTGSDIPNVYYRYMRARRVVEPSDPDQPRYEFVDDRLELWVVRTKERGPKNKNKRARADEASGGSARDNLQVARRVPRSVSPSDEQINELSRDVFELFRRHGNAGVELSQPLQAELNPLLASRFHNILQSMISEQSEQSEQGIQTDPWPDYVFTPDFHLETLQSVIDFRVMSIHTFRIVSNLIYHIHLQDIVSFQIVSDNSQVLKFAREQGHLPGVISADEVEAGNFDARREIGSVLKYVEKLCLWLNESIIDRERDFFSQQRGMVSSRDLIHDQGSSLERITSTREQLLLSLVSRQRQQDPLHQRDQEATVSGGCNCSVAKIQVLLTVVLMTGYGTIWSQVAVAESLQGAAKEMVPMLMKYNAPQLFTRMCQKFSTSEPITVAFWAGISAFVHMSMLFLLCMALSSSSCLQLIVAALRRRQMREPDTSLSTPLLSEV